MLSPEDTLFLFRMEQARLAQEAERRRRVRERAAEAPARRSTASVPTPRLAACAAPACP